MEPTPHIILNGELRREQPPKGPYIYQHLHTLGYVARHLRQHIDIIDRAANALYGSHFSATEEQLQQDITTLLSAARLSRKVSVRATIKYYPSGDYTIEYGEPSIYSGYVLRSLRYEAMLLRSEIPFSSLPTSAGRHARLLIESVARTKDKHTAIAINANDSVECESTHPIVVVKGKELVISTEEERSVEVQMVNQAAERAGYQVEHRTVKSIDIAAADELLIINWQGVTAIQSIRERQYMDIVAERLAKEMHNYM